MKQLKMLNSMRFGPLIFFLMILPVAGATAKVVKVYD